MASSLVGIDADLFEANAAVARLQQQVIDAYEANDLPRASTEEAQLQAAIAHRDDVQATKDYLVKKERLRGEAEGKLSSVLYFSQMAPDFCVDSIPSLVFAANAKNELAGITGILYVLRGWFASYLEGSETSIDRLMRRISQDTRHTHLRVVYRIANKSNAPRKFPDNGLVVRHIETPQSMIQQHPEATILWEMSTILKLQTFVPLIDVTTRGRKNAPVDGIPNLEVEAGNPSVLQVEDVANARFVCTIAPYSAFWREMNPLDQIPVLERVYALAKELVYL